jgi:outer membrane autotransporter protein
MNKIYGLVWNDQHGKFGVAQANAALRAKRSPAARVTDKRVQHVATAALALTAALLATPSSATNLNAVPAPNQAVNPTPTPQSPISAVTDNGNTPARSAAAVFDGLIASGSTGDMAQVITALGKLATAKEVSDAISQTLPVATGATAASLANTMNLSNRVVQARIESNRGLSSGDGISERNFWGKVFGSWADQKNDDGVAGHKVKSGGLIVGADAAVSANDRVGVAFTYANTDLDGKGVSSQRANIYLYQLMVYGSHSLNPTTDISWQADVGINKTDSSRTISFGDLERVAKGNYNGHSWHLGTGISRIIALNEKNNVTPSVRLDYTMVRNQAYTETGADALNLSVGKQDARQLILSGDASYNHALGRGMTLSANLGAGYDFLTKRNAVTSTFAGGGPSFTTIGAEPKKAFIRGGTGFTSLTANGLEMTARYDVEARSKFTNQTLSFKLRKEF